MTPQNRKNLLEKSCLNCELANWEGTLEDKGYCNFDESIGRNACAPAWLVEFGQYDNSFFQNGEDKSKIWKERPYLDCDGWQPIDKDYATVEWTKNYNRDRGLEVYGRRYDDDKTVGNVQVATEEDHDKLVSSDKKLQFTDVSGKPWVILIPKKLEENK
jgi:hypothetical protein